MISYKGTARTLELCNWCVNEQNDKHCKILESALLYAPPHPSFPPEWIADDESGTSARCTAFVPYIKLDKKA